MCDFLKGWCRFHESIASGQVVWDIEGLWQGVPQRLQELLENFRGTEGYAGNAYSFEWLLRYLETKGVKYASIEEMKKTLKIETEPLWFERNSWIEFVKRAIPET